MAQNFEVGPNLEVGSETAKFRFSIFGIVSMITMTLVRYLPFGYFEVGSPWEFPMKGTAKETPIYYDPYYQNLEPGSQVAQNTRPLYMKAAHY